MVSQNVRQQLSVPLFFAIEFYRVLLASLPLIFVPQICDEEICTMRGNFDKLTRLGILIHFTTTLSFVCAYSAELYREYWCIKKLDVDENLPERRIISPLISTDLKCINKIYMYSWFSASGFFLLNSIYSSYILYNHIVKSNETAITFTSYLLNVCIKIFSTHTTISSVVNDTNRISQSAYLKKNIVYNVREGGLYGVKEINSDNTI